MSERCMKLTRAQARKLAEQRQAKHYAVLIQVDEYGDYVIGHPDLPGCMAHGPTLVEAWEAGLSARKLWTEVVLEKGIPIREPRDVVDLLRIWIGEGKSIKKGRRP